MKMLITLEPFGIFGSNFVYKCIFQRLVCRTMVRLHRASFWPVKLFLRTCSKLLDGMVYFDKILFADVFQHFPASGMQNGIEASLSNILAGLALLVKMLITLDRMVYFVQIMYTYVF